jgi:hypothetical protein
MATPTVFSQRLRELSGTQQSIETMTLWFFHHVKQASELVATWFAEMRRGLHCNLKSRGHFIF